MRILGYFIVLIDFFFLMDESEMVNWYIRLIAGVEECG